MCFSAGSPGIVFVKDWATDEKEIVIHLVKAATIMDATVLPTSLNPAEISPERMEHLNKQVRRFVSETPEIDLLFEDVDE